MMESVSVCVLLCIVKGASCWFEKNQQSWRTLLLWSDVRNLDKLSSIRCSSNLSLRGYNLIACTHGVNHTERWKLDLILFTTILLIIQLTPSIWMFINRSSLSLSNSNHIFENGKSTLFSEVISFFVSASPPCSFTRRTADVCLPWIDVIDQVISFALTAIRNRAQTKLAINLGGKCKIEKSWVQW